MDVITSMFLGNMIEDWLKALVTSIGIFLIVTLIKSIGVKKLSSIASHTKTNFDDTFLRIIQETRGYFILLLGLFGGSRFLTLSEKWVNGINKAFFVVAALQVGLWLGGFINHLTSMRENQEIGDKSERTAINAFGLFGKILIWSIIGMVTVQNITGMEMSALITSLGIGGIAVGLAVQNILKDIFSSLSIFLDKTFLVGDYIVVGDIGGTVVNIGLKSTRLKTLLGEEVVFSNSDILDSSIHNYRKMERRLVTINIGVSPETDSAVLETIPAIFKTCVEKQDKATFDRANLTNIGDFTLDYELIFHIESSDYTLYANTKEAVFLDIIRQFQAKGINMPYPTQAVLLSK